MAQNHRFRVVIAHPRDIECAIFPFGRFSDHAHLRALFARFLSVDLLLLRRFKSLSIFRYDNANNLNSSLLIRKTPLIPNRLLPAAHGLKLQDKTQHHHTQSLKQYHPKKLSCLPTCCLYRAVSCQAGKTAIGFSFAESPLILPLLQACKPHSLLP
nr:MAG TPA: hypothetical protein [Caudoviricetes sp.]